MDCHPQDEPNESEGQNLVKLLLDIKRCLLRISIENPRLFNNFIDSIVQRHKT